MNKELREKAIELIKTSRGFRGREGYFAEQLEILFRTATLDEVKDKTESLTIQRMDTSEDIGYNNALNDVDKAIDNLRVNYENL